MNKDWVVVVFNEMLDLSDPNGQFDSVVGPFTESEANEYIPNPAPKGYRFVMTQLTAGDKEFQS